MERNILGIVNSKWEVFGELEKVKQKEMFNNHLSPAIEEVSKLGKTISYMHDVILKTVSDLPINLENLAVQSLVMIDKFTGEVINLSQGIILVGECSSLNEVIIDEALVTEMEHGEEIIELIKTEVAIIN